MTGIWFPVWLIYSEPEGFAIETYGGKKCLLVYPEKKAVFEVAKMLIGADDKSYRAIEVPDQIYFVSILNAMHSHKGVTHVTLNGFNGIPSRIVPLSEVL